MTPGLLELAAALRCRIAPPGDIGHASWTDLLRVNFTGDHGATVPSSESLGLSAARHRDLTTDQSVCRWRYAGQKLLDALRNFGQWTVEIVKRSAHAVGFEPLPRRWVVERTLAWLNRNRRLAKDFEASIASAKAWLIIASVQLLMRRVAYSGHNPFQFVVRH